MDEPRLFEKDIEQLRARLMELDECFCLIAENARSQALQPPDNAGSAVPDDYWTEVARISREAASESRLILALIDTVEDRSAHTIDN